MARAFVPGTTIGLLSSPSKIPSRSFGLPAVKSCPMAFFGPGAICGESKEDTTCYADGGAYVWPNVRRAYQARYDYAIKASMVPSIGDEFVTVMTSAVRQEALRQERRYYRQISKGERSLTSFEPCFRVHDSGDLFSPSYAALWVRVCEATPDVRYWFPTRMWRTKNVHMLAVLHTLASLDNTSVRPSALHFEDAAPVIPGFSAGTTAASAGFTCPASSQGNACLDCRACWSKDIEVSYRKH